MRDEHFYSTKGNLAFGKTADQSGTYGSHVASRAVDGHVGPGLNSQRCAHTNSPSSGQYSWWRVNLGAPAYILSVTVYNRLSSGECIMD